MGVWKLLLDRNTGDLVSIGSVVSDDAAERFDVVDAGDERPDQGDVVWDRQTRSFLPLPARVIRDRLDDVEAWLMSDPDFAAAWQSMTLANRQKIRTGIRRVLLALLRGRRYRFADEAVEVD